MSFSFFQSPGLCALRAFFVLATVALLTGCVMAQDDKLLDEKSTTNVAAPRLGQRPSDAQVVTFAKLALKNIHKEYPNKPNDVLVDDASVMTPKKLHPAFYGCFDWHSSVHGHWMLVKILKDYPDCSIGDEIRAALAVNLTAENLLAEKEYFSLHQHRSFERTYGWAWYFKLCEELHGWDDPQGKQWRDSLRPLEQLLVQRTKDYLPKLSFPIRTGIHPDTGFGLAFSLDYARKIGDKELEQAIVKRAKEFYAADRDYPTRYEPSGQDFFSSCLNEADLMRRVLTQDEFSQWLDQFLPGLKDGDCGNILTPAEVSDVTDGYIVHLAGLDLSRAWCMRGIANALPKGDPRGERLLKSSDAHAATGFRYVFSGHYEGEHWLASFAIYLLGESAIQD